MCTSRKGIVLNEIKVDVQKGALRFRGNLSIDVFVSSNSCFDPLLHMVIVLDDNHVCSC